MLKAKKLSARPDNVDILQKRRDHFIRALPAMTDAEWANNKTIIRAVLAPEIINHCISDAFMLKDNQKMDMENPTSELFKDSNIQNLVFKYGLPFYKNWEHDDYGENGQVTNKSTDKARVNQQSVKAVLTLRAQAMDILQKLILAVDPKKTESVSEMKIEMHNAIYESDDSMANMVQA